MVKFVSLLFHELPFVNHDVISEGTVEYALFNKQCASFNVDWHHHIPRPAAIVVHDQRVLYSLR